MTAPYRSASSMASADLPAPVGPQMTRTLLSPEAPIELIPRDLHDRRSAVHVVRWQGGAGETHVERLHLSGRQDVTGLDRRLAGDRRGESLVPRCRARHAIARERIERIAQAPQRI